MTRPLWVQHLDPIRDWYDGDGEINMTEEDIVKQVVEDLQYDQSLVQQYLPLLEAAAKELHRLQRASCRFVGAPLRPHSLAVQIENCLSIPPEGIPNGNQEATTMSDVSEARGAATSTTEEDIERRDRTEGTEA